MVIRTQIQKVYCGQCQHCLGTAHWANPEPPEHLCKIEYTVEDTPIERVKAYADCLVKNKDNNCLGFEPKPKRKWWAWLKE